MDDAGSRFPEADAVFLRDAAQEIVDLFVGAERVSQICLRLDAGENQVIAMNRSGNGRSLSARHHELQQRHLGGGVLHGDTIRVQVHVVLSPLKRARGFLREMGIEDFLRKRQRTGQQVAGASNLPWQPGIEFLDDFEVHCHERTFSKESNILGQAWRLCKPEAQLEKNSSALFTTETEDTEIPLNCGFRISDCPHREAVPEFQIRNPQSPIRNQRALCVSMVKQDVLPLAGSLV